MKAKPGLEGSLARNWVSGLTLSWPPPITTTKGSDREAGARDGVSGFGRARSFWALGDFMGWSESAKVQERSKIQSSSKAKFLKHPANRFGVLFTFAGANSELLGAAFLVERARPFGQAVQD